ncbi:hypothetical protein CDD83_5546 [Cordyceps sp. RAO-2017]|nr:hypothetical protein CDD83_5546 [Cordyceps sp. RAO-2017]
MSFPPETSHLARKIMEEAHKHLESTVTAKVSESFAGMTLEDVRKQALVIERELEARQTLRNMGRLEQLFKGLNSLKGLIEPLCSGTPYLNFVWAPITLILSIASKHMDAFEKIMEGYSLIASYAVRFERISLVFRSDKNLQNACATFYRDMLRFHAHAYRLVRGRGWKLFFKAGLSRSSKSADHLLHSMKLHARLVEKEASTVEMVAAGKMRDELQRWKEESDRRVQHYEQEQDSAWYHAIVQWLGINPANQKDVFEAVSHNAEGHDGTCSWIIANKKVQSWACKQSSTHMLWMQGKPGSGKSVLSSQMVKFMKTCNPELSVIYHFCSYSYVSTTQFKEILMSLILQLIQWQPDLSAYVYNDYYRAKKSPSVATLEQLLRCLLTNVPSQPDGSEAYVWIIIDGLDECDDDKQQALVSLLYEVSSKAARDSSRSTFCRVLISSRPSVILERLLSEEQTLFLSEEEENLENAMHLYARKRLHDLYPIRLLSLGVTSAELDQFRKSIVDKAEGKYLITSTNSLSMDTTPVLPRAFPPACAVEI